MKDPKMKAERRTIRINPVLVKKLLRQRDDYRGHKPQMGTEFAGSSG